MDKKKLNGELTNLAADIFGAISAPDNYDAPEHRNQSLGEYYYSKVNSEVKGLGVNGANQTEVTDVLECTCLGLQKSTSDLVR